MTYSDPPLHLLLFNSGDVLRSLSRPGRQRADPAGVSMQPDVGRVSQANSKTVVDMVGKSTCQWKEMQEEFCSLAEAREKLYSREGALYSRGTWKQAQIVLSGHSAIKAA